MLFPLFGFSINTLSLFGLVLAIGLVVDDAIVVVEAVERHIEDGMTPKAAAFKAMEEISGPVIGIALVLSAVFVPTAFIPGHHGTSLSTIRRDHRDFGDLSAFNALTLSPALAALLLRPKKESHAGRWENSSAGSTASSDEPPMAMCAVCGSPDPQDGYPCSHAGLVSLSGRLVRQRSFRQLPAR